MKIFEILAGVEIDLEAKSDLTPDDSISMRCASPELGEDEDDSNGHHHLSVFDRLWLLREERQASDASSASDQSSSSDSHQFDFRIELE